MKTQLSDYFKQIAFKSLSAVETDPTTSHQHEYNGISKLKDIFGIEKKEVDVVEMYLDDEHENSTITRNQLTWYDAREKHPTRSEHRLYYKSSPVTQMFGQGDLMVIAEQKNGRILNIFAKANSTAENQIKILFGIGDVSDSMETQSITGDNDKKISHTRDLILDQIVAVDDDTLKDPVADFLEEMLNKFPNGLPSTKEFSDYARNTLNDTSDDPDERIIQWWDRETQLFKIFEKYLFEQTKSSHQDDIDAFIELSLTIHNTRKSRAGYALENHLETIFNELRIPNSRTKVTENGSKPDFIFPSIDQYHDLNFPAEKLQMLGVKTTCKDRWRQVLPEADRIGHKHLFTLETAISTSQTDQMKQHKLTLVLPKSLHESYTPEQQPELLTLSDFINIVR